MASISGNGSKGHHKFTLTVTQTTQSVANNTSTLTIKFTISPIQTTWNWEQWSNKISYTVTVNGTKYSGYIPNYDGYSTVTLVNKTQNVSHNTDGTKSISFSFSVSDSTGQSYTCGNASGSGTMALTKIPRYLTITKLAISSKTETSAVVSWATSDPRNSTYYSFDGGTNWIGSATDGETLASDGKSGTFNILNLTANTSYTMKVKIKRTDSGLWTYKDLTFSTYNYPYCTNTPNFTIGDALTLDFYNPLGRSITVTGYAKTDNSQIFSGNTTGTRLIGFNDAGSIINQYASIPNSKNGQYKVVVSFGNIAMTRDNGNTYSVKGTEIPIINGFDYIDGNLSVQNITKNGKQIVQNQSSLWVTVDPATPTYGAGGISQYHLECNGKTANGSEAGGFGLGTIDSERDVDLTLTVTDSRGLSATKTINVSMLAHSQPTALVELQRLNNYEDVTYLTVDGSVSSVNDKNTMTIKYRYKALGGSYGSFTEIDDNVKQTLILDKNTVHIFEVFVTDAFGSQFSKEYTLGKGVFPLFIDTVKNSVGINCFPNEEKSLEVNGFNLFNLYKCCKNILLGSSDGLTITVNGFANSDKIPIIIAGADNASMTPVFTVIHLRSESGFGYKNLGLDSEITRNGNKLHINASQWSYFTVFAPLGADISLSNSALQID